MSNPIVRIYETEQQGRDAYDALRAQGFREDMTCLVTPPIEGETPAADAIANAMRAGYLLKANLKTYLEAIAVGHSLVVVDAPFGHARDAIAIVDGFNPLSTGLERPADTGERFIWDTAAPFSSAFRWRPLSRGRRPAPFSEALGWTVLSQGRTYGEPKYAELISSNWTLTGGFGLLSKNPAPLSSLFGGKVLMKNPRPGTSSFGLPLLTKDATPFSSLFGLPALTSNPAPLSSLFGMRVLSRHQ